jgi:hypothetical protein
MEEKDVLHGTAQQDNINHLTLTENTKWKHIVYKQCRRWWKKGIWRKAAGMTDCCEAWEVGTLKHEN